MRNLKRRTYGTSRITPRTTSQTALLRAANTRKPGSALDNPPSRFEAQLKTASLLIQNGENGEPLAYIRDQLGHSSIKMTVDVYGHLEPGRNRQAVNKLPTIKDAPAEAMKKASNS